MRTLRLSSPLMHGSDIGDVQDAVNLEFRRWHVPHSIERDTRYGPDTKGGLKTVGFGLGIPDVAQVLDHHGCTPAVQRALLDPHAYLLANPTARANYHARADWRRRLRHRFEQQGPALAVAYARSMVGVHEVPPGSNLGPHITAWERETGYDVPDSRGLGVYWCGCFVNACLMHGGFPAQPFLGYVPNIEARARGGIDGWRTVAPHDAAAGDIACFGSGEHTEFVIARRWPLRTIGGNTSKGDGSPNNGGVVAEHDFAHYRGLPLDVIARPPWGRLH